MVRAGVRGVAGSSVGVVAKGRSMKVLEAVEVSLGWKDLDVRTFHPRPTHTRTKGVRHVSAIIKHIAIATKMMQEYEVDLEEYPLRMAMGVAWEEMACGLYGNGDGFTWQPKEVMRDGVVGSPDAEVKKAGRIVQIDEFKFTHLSCRTKTIADMWMYLTQGQAYCAMHKDRPRLVRYHILHACGDYARPFKEKYMRYLCEFTETEIEACWRMIVAHKEMVEAER